MANHYNRNVADITGLRDLPFFLRFPMSDAIGTATHMDGCGAWVSQGYQNKTVVSKEGESIVL